MSKLTKVTNTSLNIGKILDVLEKDDASLNNVVNLSRIIDMTINTVQRYIQRNLRDNSCELDFMAEDLNIVAVRADFYIDKFRKDILFENALSEFKDENEVGSDFVDVWTKRLTDTLYAIKMLTHLSNVFHYLSAIISLLENEEDDFNSASSISNQRIHAQKLNYKVSLLERGNMGDTKEGKVHAVTGFAKFKTSSASGTSLRAINQGWQVLIFQFLKGSVTGEVELLSKTFPDNVTIRRYGADKIILPNNVEAFDKDETQRGWTEMLELTKTDKYDLLILDEVFCALDLNLLYQYQYFYFLKEKPKKLEVISTGRVIDKALMRKITDASDLHTDAYMVKHYMNRKCPTCKHTWKWSDNYCSYCGEQLPAPVFARKGIEL